MTDPYPPDHRIAVGRVKRAHGIRGAVLVAPTTDDPGRFRIGSSVRIDGATEDVTVVACQPHTEGLIVFLDGITDRTAAEGLRHRSLTIDVASRRSLAEDEWWTEDLVGRSAVTPGGTVLGTVTDVVLGGAQDRLVVTTPDGVEVDVPFVTALVPEVTPGSITVDPPEDLFPGPG